MKKLFLGVLCCACLVGCGNQQFIDTTYTFHKAIIEIKPGETIEVNVSSWGDYSDGDQIQIKTTDGITYLVHSSKCILIQE